MAAAEVADVAVFFPFEVVLPKGVFEDDEEIVGVDLLGDFGVLGWLVEGESGLKYVSKTWPSRAKVGLASLAAFIALLFCSSSFLDLAINLS